MNRPDPLDDILRRILALGPEDDLRETAYRATPTWDSVAHLQLLDAIEASYGMRIEADRLPLLTDYAALRSLVAGFETRGSEPTHHGSQGA